MKCIDSNDVDECYKKLIRLCEIKERCTYQLQIKLVKGAGFSDVAFKKSCARAKEYGIVSDSRYAESYIRNSVAANKGSHGIIKHLDVNNINYRKNKIISGLISSAQENDLERAVYFAKHARTNSKNPFKATMAKLIRRGFSIDIAYKATKLIYS